MLASSILQLLLHLLLDGELHPNATVLPAEYLIRVKRWRVQVDCGISRGWIAIEQLAELQP